MFTGIVEEAGVVTGVEHRRDSAVITIEATFTTDVAMGESICVNGVCLTVADLDERRFTADVMRQTLDLTNLGTLGVGTRVNLERAMPADGRFSGHIVQGHVDAIARVQRVEPDDDWTVITLDLPPDLARYVVAQGSIILDGVSLTVSSLADTEFQVSLIPTTLELTTLGQRRPGDTVNVEVDVLAKYVERLLGAATPAAAPAVAP